MKRTGNALARTAASALVAITTAAWAGPPVSQGTDSGVTLTAPDASESFTFVVFGDRTGGPKSGVKVLAKAVETASWLDPDFVITVGDLVQGYNAAEPWLEEMREFKSIMGDLPMPWYPVAGNHDVYARPATPQGHVALYQEHFGPLYYSFTHKFAHFVVLYSDESLAFHDPARNQNMSDEQLAWLRSDLANAEADRVFVLIHHPRWLDRYAGSNWDQVHQAFVDDARPTTVIGGHIHAIRDDGATDNVRYLTMGTVGADPVREFSHASIDHIALVHVRPERESVVHVPMDAVRPAAHFPGWESDEIRDLNRAGWIEIEGRAAIGPAPGQTRRIAATLTNPTRKPIEVNLVCDAPRGWTITPSETRVTLQPGQTTRWAFDAAAPALGDQRPELVLRVRALYPLEHARPQPVSVRLPIPVDAAVDTHAHADHQHADRPANGVLRLDGRSAVRVDLPADRPDAFTLEAWVRADAPVGRQGLICNTENSGLGIFWSDAADGASLPTGYAHVAGAYARAGADRPWDFARWTHLALVLDARTLRFFVNGRLTQSAPADGAIRHNRLPLLIGADVNPSAEAVSFFTGEIDEVRLSSVARYESDFTPARSFAPDAQTLILLHFDEDLGIVFPDRSGNGSHGWAVGSPEIARQPRD
tara:strand:+ start:3510 stop:5453 length:1944 start_codon:yes stop_codon:yes gene_type:complete